MTRVIHARSIARLGIGVLIMLVVLFTRASACDKYVITGATKVGISVSHENAQLGILEFKNVDLPAGGADTVIVSLDGIELSFNEMPLTIPLFDTTQIAIQYDQTDHHLSTVLAWANFYGFANNKARIGFGATLSDKNGDDHFYANITASVLFLKCCDVSCGTSDSSTISFDFGKLREQFGALNAEVNKLKTQVADLERRR
ncbi:MAG: hypothetical protein WBP42_02570 [Candidatus Zixiibacteriota bacterium]